MTSIYVDATTLIALGMVGELDLLTEFDGQVVILPAVRDEVTSEPAKANLERFIGYDDVNTASPADPDAVERAVEILGEGEPTSDARLLTPVLSHLETDEPVVLVSDDRRLRTVARGLGAQVTGTLGVVINAVGASLSAEEAESLVRRLDETGLHLTGELRDAAFDLIDEADKG